MKAAGLGLMGVAEQVEDAAHDRVSCLFLSVDDLIAAAARRATTGTRSSWPDRWRNIIRPNLEFSCSSYELFSCESSYDLGLDHSNNANR